MDVVEFSGRSCTLDLG